MGSISFLTSFIGWNKLVLGNRITTTALFLNNAIKSLHIIPIKGCGAMAFFASSVIGSFSTVCVSALTPNAVDKITSMVRLWSHLEKKRINSIHITYFAQRPRKGRDGTCRNYQGTYDWYFMLILLQILYVYTSCMSIFFRFGVVLSYIWNLWHHFNLAKRDVTINLWLLRK